MRPIETAIVICLLSLLSDVTTAAKFDSLRYFKVDQGKTKPDGQFQDKMPAAARSAENVKTEPVTSPKDAVYRLSYENYDMTWKQFKLDHNRSYDSASEEHTRFAIFMDNVKIIERHNWQFHNGLTTYWMDINQFSDWTKEERQALLCPKKVDESPPRENDESVDVDFMNMDVPSSIDWRTQGYVTAVKQQGECRSCYAFAATGSLEGQWFKKTGQLIPLSEQQIVDCTWDFGNIGCGGGWVDNVYEYIKTVGGIESELEYPYFAKQRRCDFKEYGRVVANIHGYKVVQPVRNETALQKAVAAVGPIAASFAVTNKFFSYKGGIFEDDECFFKEADHCVLVVGYGKNNTKFWTVKNSWGVEWGVNGYAFVARDNGNMCEIASESIYPIV